MSNLDLRLKRIASMILFIQRHRIESRIGNINPDPITPVNFTTDKIIPRYIYAGSEEYEIYSSLNPSDQVFPVK